MTVFDDGSGAALYIGGAFVAAGGVPTGRIATTSGWNSSTKPTSSRWSMARRCGVDNDGGVVMTPMACALALAAVRRMTP